MPNGNNRKNAKELTLIPSVKTDGILEPIIVYKEKGDEKFKEYVADNLHKHSPGSFMWYNMKNIGKSLSDKQLVREVTTDFLVSHSVEHKVNLCTHFCESYLMNFLKEDECYSVKDYNEIVHNMEGTLYTQLYPSKLIAREFLKDFEKYLIDYGWL